MDCLVDIKEVIDQLAIIRALVMDKDVVQQPLSDLGPEFKIFCITLELYSALPPFEEPKTKLI